MVKFNLSDSLSAIPVDIKRVSSIPSPHNANVKLLNSPFKREKKKKTNLAPLAAIQPCYTVSLLCGLVPGGCTRDQLPPPGLWRPHQPGQPEGRSSTPPLTELQPDSPSLLKGNAGDMQCPLVVLIFPFPSGLKYFSSDFSCFNSLQHIHKKNSFLSLDTWLFYAVLDCI